VQTIGKGAESQAEVCQRGRWGEEFGRVPGNQLCPDGREKGMGVFADCQKVVNVDADDQTRPGAIGDSRDEQAGVGRGGAEAKVAQDGGEGQVPRGGSARETVQGTAKAPKHPGGNEVSRRADKNFAASGRFRKSRLCALAKCL
jgi:hypothetical protein